MPGIKKGYFQTDFYKNLGQSISSLVIVCTKVTSKSNHLVFNEKTRKVSKLNNIKKWNNLVL